MSSKVLMLFCYVYLIKTNEVLFIEHRVSTNDFVYKCFHRI